MTHVWDGKDDIEHDDDQNVSWRFILGPSQDVVGKFGATASELESQTEVHHHHDDGRREKEDQVRYDGKTLLSVKFREGHPSYQHQDRDTPGGDHHASVPEGR